MCSPYKTEEVFLGNGIQDQFHLRFTHLIKLILWGKEKKSFHKYVHGWCLSEAFVVAAAIVVIYSFSHLMV